MAAIRAILEKRNAIVPGEWDDIDAHRLRLGMSGCAVLAILGAPISTVDKGPVETLTFAGRRVVQLRGDKAISITP